jgi:hypothetical protein
MRGHEAKSGSLSSRNTIKQKDLDAQVAVVHERPCLGSLAGTCRHGDTQHQLHVQTETPHSTNTARGQACGRAIVEKLTPMPASSLLAGQNQPERRRAGHRFP